jgi:hypothetical protein
VNWLRQNWRRVPSMLPAWCWRGICFFWKGAWDSHVPLVWNVLVVILASAGTYYLSPGLTEKFERQKIRAGYISANLSEMNKLVGDFYVAVMEASSVTNPDGNIEKFRKVDEVAARLSWKSVEISAVLNSPSDRKLMQRFQKELRDAQAATVRANTPQGRSIFVQSLQRFASTSVEVIQGVARRADVADVDNKPLVPLGPSGAATEGSGT